MKCEVMRNGNKIYGPVEYDAQVLRKLVANQGGNPDLVPPGLSAAVSFSGIVIKPVRDIKPSLTTGQRYGSPTREETDSDVRYTYAVVDKSDVDLRGELVKQLASVHNNYEGSRFDFNGVLIKADLEARTNAIGTLDLFKDGLLTAVEWRGKVPGEANPGELEGDFSDDSDLQNGRVVINGLAEMQGLYGAMVGYLDNGFTAKSSVEDAIASADRETLISFYVKGEFDTIAAA